MRKLPVLLLAFFMLPRTSHAQSLRAFADSLRIACGIPELAYAVVSADRVLDSGIGGVQRTGTAYPASMTDRFHIGSNTKAITSILAARLVQQGALRWDTRFFDLFPELLAGSREAYRGITLEQLLCFRARLPKYTYTFERPAVEEITGTPEAQHLALARYLLRQPPQKIVDGLTPTNADYILAGLMIERAGGTSNVRQLQSLGSRLGIRFGADYPNLSDTLQPWGHDTNSVALPPMVYPKLRWLEAAGNINLNLPDYTVLLREFLRGLQGRSELLPAAVWRKLLAGRERFCFGWFQGTDPVSGQPVAHNEGNAGAFYSSVRVLPAQGVAIVVLANSVSERSTEGVDRLMEEAARRYGIRRAEAGKKARSGQNGTRP